MNVTKSVKIALGSYLIAGCFVGLYAASRGIESSWGVPSLVWVGFVFAAFYLAIGLSGYYLIRTSNYSRAAIILQVLQLVGFSAFGIKYQFCAGTSLKIGYQGHTLLYILEPINVEFTLGKNSRLEFFYINLIPVVVIFLLVHFFQQSKNNISDQVTPV